MLDLVTFDETDSDIESEYSKIITEKNILNKRVRELEIF